jgi:2-deoxy-D-gluconate 3-dehydrogenase
MAEWLAREGANIIVTGRDRAAVDASVVAVEAIGVRAWGIPADLARPEEARRLARQALETVDRIDIIVNNAGMSISQPFWEASDTDWDEEITTNLRSPFILNQHAARHMMERSIRGRIVNVSTIGVFAGHRDKMVYNIAKAGVQAMTRNMAFELAPHGITVNCVAPGAVPDRPGNDYGPEPSEADQYARAIPSGRLGRAEDIATAVIFFSLPESEWTTGQTLLVDGGHLSYLPD